VVSAIMRSMDSGCIHPTAVIDSRARLGERVRVGPYAVIEAAVNVGDDCDIGAHALLSGPLTLGPRNRVGAHAVLGQPPQDHGYQGEPTELIIGSDNDLREFVTIHRASTKDQGITRVGNHNLLMAYSHIGHDCQLANHIAIANAAHLAGHVHIADRVYVSALCGVHQFVRIGTLALLGAGTMVSQDVAPFCMVVGNRAQLKGLNSVGLRRAGYDRAARQQIRTIYDVIFRTGQPLSSALEQLQKDPQFDGSARDVMYAFCQASRRGIIR